MQALLPTRVATRTPGEGMRAAAFLLQVSCEHQSMTQALKQPPSCPQTDSDTLVLTSWGRFPRLVCPSRGMYTFFEWSISVARMEVLLTCRTTCFGTTCVA